MNYDYELEKRYHPENFSEDEEYQDDIEVEEEELEEEELEEDANII